MKRFFTTIALIVAFSMVLGIGSSWAAEKEVTIGYQLVYNPWKTSIVDGTFEKETGYKISWKKFDSGAKVINAMASGDVHISLAGSSPIAAGVSRGLDIQLVWVFEDIASAEALVVRNGSGIMAPQDLKGKKLGVPFVSTTHFHTLFALEQFGSLSRTVLEYWGIYKTEDIGEIVFNLVEAGLLNKQDSDCKADFANGFNFREAFEESYSPDIPWHYY